MSLWFLCGALKRRRDNAWGCSEALHSPHRHGGAVEQDILVREGRNFGAFPRRVENTERKSLPHSASVCGASTPHMLRRALLSKYHFRRVRLFFFPNILLPVGSAPAFFCVVTTWGGGRRKKGRKRTTDVVAKTTLFPRLNISYIHFGACLEGSWAGPSPKNTVGLLPILEFHGMTAGLAFRLLGGPRLGCGTSLALWGSSQTGLRCCCKKRMAIPWALDDTKQTMHACEAV